MSLIRAARIAGIAATATAMAFAVTPANAAGGGVSVSGTSKAAVVSTAPTATVINATGPGSHIKSIPSSWVSCSGQLLDKVPVLDAKKKVVAELDVYYLPSHNNTVIGCMKHMGAYKGVREATMVSIAGCTMVSCKSPAAITTAKGNFTSYAGPAAVAGLKGKDCVKASGVMVMNSKLMAVAVSRTICGK